MHRRTTAERMASRREEEKKKPWRLWELMKSRGRQNQQVVLISDSGENARRTPGRLHPFGEHLIDWFPYHVLQQQTKALQRRAAANRRGCSERLESVNYLLWHGNTEEALDGLVNLRIHCARGLL